MTNALLDASEPLWAGVESKETAPRLTRPFLAFLPKDPLAFPKAYQSPILIPASSKHFLAQLSPSTPRTSYSLQVTQVSPETHRAGKAAHLDENHSSGRIMLGLLACLFFPENQHISPIIQMIR